MTDRTLIERSAAGDREAFDALIRPRLGAMFHTALGILRHEADARDVVQEACLGAWRALCRLKDPERFDAWLTRILVNGCRDRLRARSRTRVSEIHFAIAGDGTSQPPTQASMAAEVDESRAIRRAFERLRPDQRVLLALHHADGRPIQEIARVLDLPEGTVKWRLHAARQALAAALERER